MELRFSNQDLKKLIIPLVIEQVLAISMNIDRCANTSSATIPILLDEINQKGMLNRGDKIVLSGFGGGLTWGSVYLTW